jgi:hypothetical protein
MIDKHQGSIGIWTDMIEGTFHLDLDESACSKDCHMDATAVQDVHPCQVCGMRGREGLEILRLQVYKSCTLSRTGTDFHENTVDSPQIKNPPDPGKAVALRTCHISGPHAIAVWLPVRRRKKSETWPFTRVSD